MNKNGTYIIRQLLTKERVISLILQVQEVLSIIVSKYIMKFGQDFSDI